MVAITIYPPILDLAFYAGDGLEFTINCVDKQGNPINLTGEMEAQIRLDRVTEGTPITEFIIDMTLAATGGVTVSLTGTQTQQLIAHGAAGKFAGVWDLEWTAPGSQPRTICQGTVGCNVDVTR